MTLAELRAKLPGVHDRAFLNYAATAPMTRDAADEIGRVVQQGLAPLADHFDDWFRLLEDARREVAFLVGATPGELAFTANTSTSLSLVAASIRWREGDRVLHPADEFASNRYVWQNLATFGVRAEPVPVEENVPFAEQLASMDLDGVRLVSVSHVSYRDGRRHDVAALARLLRPRGILLCVDGIQAAGAIPVDAHALGADFYAGGGQKWLLGPLGAGYLVVRAALLDTLHAPLAGWASARTAPDSEVERFEPADGARRLEPGLPDVAAIAGLAASVRALRRAGLAEAHAAVARHEKRLREALQAAGHHILAADAPRAGIVTIEAPDNADAARLHTACAAAGIALTLRGRHVRVAAHATTTDEDLQRFLAALPPPSSRTPTPPVPAGPRAPAARDAPSDAPLAIVTGATRGLGRGIAVALERRGHRVLPLARGPGGADLVDAAALRRWLDEHADELARCEVLVNAAAAADAALFSEQSEERARRALQANVLAPMALARATLPGMLSRRRGHVLNVVASGARNAFPLFSTYAATKGALWAWSESLTRELAGSGVHVLTFLPPHMETATRRHLGRAALAHYDIPRDAGDAADPADVGERAVAALLEGRAFVAPWSARVQLAANALAPQLVARRIARVWRPL